MVGSRRVTFTVESNQVTIQYPRSGVAKNGVWIAVLLVRLHVFKGRELRCLSYHLAELKRPSVLTFGQTGQDLPNGKRETLGAGISLC